jgi:hypothetical protein
MVGDHEESMVCSALLRLRGVTLMPYKALGGTFGFFGKFERRRMVNQTTPSGSLS